MLYILYVRMQDNVQYTFASILSSAFSHKYDYGRYNLLPLFIVLKYPFYYRTRLMCPESCFCYIYFCASYFAAVFFSFFLFFVQPIRVTYAYWRKTYFHTLCYDIIRVFWCLKLYSKVFAPFKHYDFLARQLQ